MGVDNVLQPVQSKFIAGWAGHFVETVSKQEQDVAMLGGQGAGGKGGLWEQSEHGTGRGAGVRQALDGAGRALD